MDEYRLITLDPGHFHAALIQKEAYPGVSDRVAVYAPLSSDLTEHMNRVARFNQRKDKPTSWELDVHASPDYLARMAADRPGNIVVLSGRNRLKIAYIRAALEAGLHVLADKPWIIRIEDLPALEEALALAGRKNLIAYDIMTERYEITSILQRELVNAPEVFGSIVPGSLSEPAVYMESVHHLLKLVAGVPNLRPAWFFDVLEQGEALADVGTHLVDLAQWTLFPNAPLDYRTDIETHAGGRWPTKMTAEQFRQVTGQPGPGLDYYCNTRVQYALKGIHVKLDVLWNWEAPAGGGDTHLAIYRGTRSRVEVRQGKAENYVPELFVVGDVGGPLTAKVAELAKTYPGIAVESRAGEFRIAIPDTYRVGHEAHFAQVTNRFFEYLRNPGTMPAWEDPYMLAKYFATTKGTELSHRGGAVATT
jgi:predicted dehydrogenase